jgi:hypothetical protein
VQEQTHTQFSFFCPAELAKSVIAGVDPDDLENRRDVEGRFTTDAEDEDRERVSVRGMDTSYFRKNGWIIDDHDVVVRDQHTKIPVNIIPSARVGVATDLQIGDHDGWVKSEFLPWDTRHRPDCRCAGCRSFYWISIMRSLEKSKSGRRVGFSVQGDIERRSGGAILGSTLRFIAITDSPKNLGTFAQLAKSLAAQPWCCDPERPAPDSCKCDGCRVGAEAEQKRRADRLSFDEAVAFIQQTRGWDRDASRFAATAIFRAHVH